jgi:hypothetical protein
MTSKKVLSLIEKSGQVAPGKSLEEMKQVGDGRAGTPFSSDHYIDLTRGIGRTFDVFHEGL